MDTGSGGVDLDLEQPVETLQDLVLALQNVFGFGRQGHRGHADHPEGPSDERAHRLASDQRMSEPCDESKADRHRQVLT